MFVGDTRRSREKGAMSINAKTISQAEGESMFLDLEELGVSLNLLDLAIKGLTTAVEANNDSWDANFRAVMDCSQGRPCLVEVLVRHRPAPQRSNLRAGAKQGGDQFGTVDKVPAICESQASTAATN
jgi:hypothetical protein